MVKFWPFGGDDTGAAAFEKTLARLSERINKASTKDTKLRTQQRRYRALWTLYTGFAYLLAVLILVLVVGRTNWDVTEYTALAGTPPLIYLVRLVINTFYNYRINGTQSYLEDLYKQRSDAIEKLKAATKYNSTQQLLDKYGGSAPKPAKTPGKERKASSNQKPVQEPPVQRTGIAPPPTANIARPGPPPTSPAQGTPQRPDMQPRPADSRHSPQPSEEFAPNAFSYPTAPAPSQVPASHAYDTGSGGPKWYDRIMDLVLGEDETQPRNRIVLICGQCRLVNGQAPPGTQSLEHLGRWRCMACGAMNGTESAAEKAVKEVIGSPTKSDVGSVPTSPVNVVGANDIHEDDVEESLEEDEDVSAEDRPATPLKTSGRTARGQARQRKK
ncbi:Protein lunapark [Elsinoe australis]|uniref:Endoplasmic reticulum junction formation protein lunapark n=1 Tax=Elsinoe australis TaxID=40998 RepID=A0A2P7Z729_9PEZI|nr:Protein lunapark [Elsinoe australis]